MRLLLYSTSHRLGGAEHYLVRLADYLRGRGHHIVIVSKPRGELTRRLREADHDVRTWRMWGKLDFPSLLRVAQLLRAEEIDVVITFLSTAHWLGARAGRRAGRPVVARIAATNSVTTFRRADWWWAVSEGVRAHLVGRGLPAERIVTLYNGIDLARFEAMPGREEARVRWDLPPDAVAIGVVANLVARKGHRFLIEAAAAAQKEWQAPLHLLFAGEGPEREALERMAAGKGLTDRVHFLGYLGDVRPLLAALDLFVLPSLQEGLPNAVMEAMAAGVPVIATAIAGVPEVVLDGETGLLVPPADPQALSRALLWALRHPDRILDFTVNARRRLEERFDQRTCLQRVEGFLERVTGRQ